MKLRHTALSVGFAALSLASSAAYADVIPYPNTGTQNPQSYTFTAASSGDVIAYFDGYGGASYEEVLGLLVNGVSTGVTGLDNHASSYGQSLDLGYAPAGASLIFDLYVYNTGNTWYSDTSLNADGANHIYSTSFSGGDGIPAGTYVGFEDLAANVADFNYTDEQFVFTNTSVSPVPLPGALPMFGAALLGLAGLGATKARRKITV